MAYKQMNPNAFKIFETFGMKISNLSDTFGNLSLGLRMGGFNLITVFFGLFSVKFVNIPL